ncbi:hypothetical protein GOP47_0021364 [Adiantum capillus-veneris]|uniref:C2H2-type domain-containing protein n=1 Tax=Adiantum capillus-veneris TaxID=13818 RepID=A0A9D4U882_ADICA|nr:hypothetical protein GOP47_0021364 [Adiantum capillus-veneris]
MGRCPNHKNSKKKGLSHKSARRAKFLSKGVDMIYQELSVGAVVKTLPLSEDLPGMGQFYCLHCDRYFASAGVRDDHFKTKRHKKKVKMMQGDAPHSQLDADLAAVMEKCLRKVLSLEVDNKRNGESSWCEVQKMEGQR